MHAAAADSTDSSRGGLDVALALEKLRTRFEVRTLMLEGGGKINGTMLRAGLIDEVSVIVAPVADGRMGTAALYDVERGEMPPVRLALRNVEQRGGGLLWLRYSVDYRA